jgi:4-amino-4-deoxy-L-arabinose transferase-like glycosyltransferase
MTREKKLRVWTGAALALVTLLTRFPYRSRTFFEFDSINFAVATFRFALSQVTPQIPGYMLHVLLGRLMFFFTGDLNQAYIWVGILLSIGSVLFLWRATAVLRGERVGIVAAMLWLTTPLFWFHGAVNAIYVEEAFYTSVLLYLGMKWLSSERRSWEVIVYCIALSLATGTRQTSILFFLPATLFLFWKRRPSKKIFILALLCFVVASGAWMTELFREAGGLTNYLIFAKAESNFKTQSVLFGNSWQSQWDTIGKVLFYFVLSLGSTWVMVFTLDVWYARRSVAFIREHARNPKAIFILLIAFVPLLFYMLVFFMKAGYLLNVVPTGILVRSVLVDQFAIWLAEREKKRRSSSRPLKLTRPIITRNVILITGALVLLNILWFFIPWPGTDQKLYDNEDTRNSFIHGAMHRYEHSDSRMLTLANRALEYTNISGIRAVDSLNSMTFRALVTNGGNDSGQVILASWWYRWCYLQLPHAVTYDLELNPVHPDSLRVGRANEMERINLYDAVIRFHSSGPVLLLLRHDRPDFEQVARQVHLERLPLPEYLDIYKILDSTFTLRWGNRTFISE